VWSPISDNHYTSWDPELDGEEQLSAALRRLGLQALCSSYMELTEL